MGPRVVCENFETLVYPVDEKTSRERVALAHEEIESYEPPYYETELVRAVESLLSPLGWDRSKIRRELAEIRLTRLLAFTEAGF